MTPTNKKPKPGAGEKKLRDHLILIFWSGAGGIKLMNRLILSIWVLLGLSIVAVLTAAVGSSRRGVEAHNRQKIVKEILQAVEANVPEIASSDTSIPINRVAVAVRNAVNDDMIDHFWLCQPGDDTEPLVVYSGPLTAPFVMILWRHGGTSSWPVADWERHPTHKTAVNLKELHINR